jgi:hypothetical protein
MKKIILAAILLAGGSLATTLDDVPYDTTMWSALDPFGFATLRTSASSNWVNSVVSAHGTNTTVHANKVDWTAFTATNAVMWGEIVDLAVRKTAWNEAYDFIATGTAWAANNSNRINTANVNIANNSNRVNAANANIANTSNSVVALDAKLVATSNVLASAIGEGGSGITAPTATNISESVLAPYTNSIATAWQNPASATNWTWTSDGTQITLTGYNFISMDVVIPDTLDGLPVTGFSATIFSGVEGTGTPITSVSGGKNITTIGEAAFADCDSLTSIDLPQATTIGEAAFSFCDSLTSIDLPQATTIGGYAFSNCDSLTSIDLPQATTIGGLAFANCDSLTSIDLPQATTIGVSAFANCTSLTSIVWGQNSPTEPAGLYYGIPANQVTNYVTNPTATGWGATFGGMPVMRMPIEAKEATIGTVISITSTTTGTNTAGYFQGDGSLLTGLPSGASSAPLAWTPIATVASASVATATVTTVKSVYSFTTATAISYTNDLSQLALNCGTNYEWETWINYTDTNALSTVWDSRIEWQTGTPDLTVTGKYVFAFSTACGTSILGRQVYPTAYMWSHALVSASSSVSTSVDARHAIVNNTITYPETNTIALGISSYYPMLVMTDTYGGTADTNRLSIGLMVSTYGVAPTSFVGTPLLTKRETASGRKYKKFFLPASTNSTRYVYLGAFMESGNGALYIPGVLSRQANELEIKAYAAGWRPL